MYKLLAICALATVTASAAAAPPFHDAIPMEFRGSYGATAAACGDRDGVNRIKVDADGVQYYEGNDYLILGVSFSGASAKTGKFIPLFNGRFTGRMETQLMGETNVRMELEAPDLLIRYVLDDDGEPKATATDSWVRCK